MDNIKFNSSGPSLTPPPVGEPGLPDIHKMYDILHDHMLESGYKSEWMYGKMFGRDVLITPNKMITDLLNIITSHIKEDDKYIDSMPTITRQAISEAMKSLLSTYDNSSQNLESSKKMIIKLLGYIFTLHVLQQSVKS